MRQIELSSDDRVVLLTALECHRDQTRRELLALRSRTAHDPCCYTAQRRHDEELLREDLLADRLRRLEMLITDAR